MDVTVRIGSVLKLQSGSAIIYFNYYVLPVNVEHTRSLPSLYFECGLPLHWTRPVKKPELTFSDSSLRLRPLRYQSGS